jgi:nicotinate-nucleotide adenylyltransferase
MRLGLLGGSFNPIHHGHLITAVRAAEAARLDRVVFIPAAVSPLKSGRGLAPDRDRWTMLKAALRGNPLFEASDVELRRGGVSYTVDTLREFRRATRARLYWILGTDAAAQLHRWKSPEEIRRLAELVVVVRPGARIPRSVPKESVVRAPLLEISSSEIRDRVRRGLSVRYMVPDAVERQIRRKGLYR